MSCDSPCQELYLINLPACPEEIEINSTSLEADTEYTYELIDSLGVHYKNSVTTNGYSNLVIDTTELPAGLLIPEHGDFTLNLYDSDGQKVDLTFQAKQYTSVLISFYNYQGVASAIIE